MLILKDVYSADMGPREDEIPRAGPFFILVDFYIGDSTEEGADIYRATFLSEDSTHINKDPHDIKKKIVIPVISWRVIDVIVDNIIIFANNQDNPKNYIRNALDWEYENYM